MKRITLIICAAAMVIASCNSETKSDKTTDDSLGSSDTKKEEPWVPIDSAKAMQAMIEYGTPGPMHTMMASWNGTWQGEMTMWMSEDAPPTKAVSTAVNSMTMGNRIHVTKYSGDMMGMPFEGQGTMGYDNATKEFVSTWIDNMSTGIMTLRGPYDEATKTITISGKVPDFTRPGKWCDMRETFQIIDENTQLMSMYGPGPKTGKEMKMFEIKLTRKK